MISKTWRAIHSKLTWVRLWITAQQCWDTTGKRWTKSPNRSFSAINFVIQKHLNKIRENGENYFIHGCTLSSHRDAVSLQSGVTSNHLIYESLNECHPIHIEWDSFPHKIWKIEYWAGLFQEEAISSTVFRFFGIHKCKESPSSDTC